MTFFNLMFGLDLYNDNLDAITFPTFEEVLGLIDLAVARGEGFRDFELINMASNSGRLHFVRLYLIILMAKSLKDSLEASATNYHLDFVTNLRTASLLDDIVFFSANYDLLLDNALITVLSKPGGPGPIDYAVEFCEPDSWTTISSPAIPLYKVHGSLNWMYCPVCNTLRYTPLEKGIVALYENPHLGACLKCESVYQPLIVPPTVFKNMANPFLTAIWQRAERALRDIQHLVFCGYSFPDADLHVKYLLKRVQTSAHALRQVTVLNHYPGKRAVQAKEEESRFKRFLGNSVDFAKASFTDLAANPSRYIFP